MPALLLIGLFVALVVLAPLATIWALNTLFAVAIPYTFVSWLATFWLTLVVAAERNKS
jgi:hypothetical protein